MYRFATFFAFLLIFALFLGVLLVPATVVAEITPPPLPTPVRQPPATSAEGAVLYDPQSGSFLVERNADRRLPMASTTKIMTALVVLEQCNLSATVTVPKEAVGIEGSSIYLYEGEKITVRTLLYGLLLSSANDAATALALHAAGSVPAFAALMNEKAASLGLSDTHFTNPHGLHDEAHYTTARELALISAAAMQNPTFAEIVRTPRYTAPQNGTEATRLFLNHNRLLRTCEGVIGIKTGFTKASGRCLVSAAARNGLLLIAVTLNDGNDWRDHAALYDWAYEEYEAFTPQTVSISLPVIGGEDKEVKIIAQGTVAMTLPTVHGEITATTELPRFLYAGFAAGERVGTLVYRMDGKIIAALPLITANGVEKNQLPRTFFEKIQDLFQ
ncbi:MAG: D-alanyl-D-alanine carboxypeptidase [Clostridia bacterium]|nr:D-alanyl-D-alanine carboxypeptidase [Clostridia bacterium]